MMGTHTFFFYIPLAIELAVPSTPPLPRPLGSYAARQGKGKGGWGGCRVRMSYTKKISRSPALKKGSTPN